MAVVVGETGNRVEVGEAGGAVEGVGGAREVARGS
jgi:hypothetical protein